MLIKKIKAQWIVFEWSADYFEFYSEHSLLYDYTDNSVELYFRNTSYNPEKLFVDVFTIDQTLFDGKRRFGTYLNTANGLYGLCKQSHGLFARGPQRVIEHYAKCLAKHGMETSIIMQNEQEFQIENGLVLLLVGESYFIGQDFIFTRLH
ncbi:MAG: hypothetical protein JNL32_06620 [Candidatus Kapabacteria bacterium]|nr:hypothetical protein [Candidatus Kapabacteria bacterium]